MMRYNKRPRHRPGANRKTQRFPVQCLTLDSDNRKIRNHDAFAFITCHCIRHLLTLKGLNLGDAIQIAKHRKTSSIRHAFNMKQ
jgi:hypothetical protein